MVPFSETHPSWSNSFSDGMKLIKSRWLKKLINGRNTFITIQMSVYYKGVGSQRGHGVIEHRLVVLGFESRNIQMFFSLGYEAMEGVFNEQQPF